MAEIREASEDWDAVVTLGTILAVAISWTANRSILWAVLHGLCSWLYVIYYAATTWNQGTP